MQNFIVLISPQEEILVTEQSGMTVRYTNMDDSGESYLVMQPSRNIGTVVSFIDLCHTNQHVHL